MGAETADEEAIALTEISWEKSMRNEENPRTGQEVIRTETSISTVSSPGQRKTQHANPLFAASGVDGGGDGAPAAASGFGEGSGLGGGGEDVAHRSPPKLNPIYADQQQQRAAEAGAADAAEGGAKVRFNSLAEPETGGDGDGAGGSGAGADPGAGEDEEGEKVFSMRTKAREFVYSIYVQGLVIFLLVLDGALLITEVLVDRGDTSDESKLRVHKAVDICVALIVITLFFEICLRIVADSPQAFVRKWLNLFDLFITVGSVVMVMIDLEYVRCACSFPASLPNSPPPLSPSFSLNDVRRPGRTREKRPNDGKM